ncbi:MAG: hypothetical protein A3E85_02255 [Gammaproteobacteria bacterium RIFCSPHIGHO2_12_FULL_45_12]|nr:MAG: hypothetical protein A3E85_02255 [Gammaproteobacteria bacterium RIFCSPHIGHO2_12_FULL_45_12]
MEENNLKKLRWACRRGMLELDVLLGNFLKGGYPQLTEVHQKQFSRLLTFPDPVLLAWLLGKETPVEAEMAHMVDLIRRHASHSR